MVAGDERVEETPVAEIGDTLIVEAAAPVFRDGRAGGRRSLRRDRTENRRRAADQGDAESVAVRAGAAPPVFPQAGGQVKVPAAWLIERAGYAKGTREGAVGLSSKHTLAIVTRDGATAADVIRFACRVAQRVEARFGVRLRPEPVLLGFAGSDVEADVEYLLGARN